MSITTPTDPGASEFDQAQLDAAESLVVALLVNDLFEVDDEGIPVHEPYAEAIRKAVVAQAGFSQAWSEVGKLGTGSMHNLTSVSLGPLSMSSGGGVESTHLIRDRLEHSHPSAPGMPMVSLVALNTLRRVGLASAKVVR